MGVWSQESQGSLLHQGQTPVQEQDHQENQRSHTIDPNRHTVLLMAQCKIIRKCLSSLVY